MFTDQSSINQIIEQMSLKEKILTLTGESMFKTPGIPRLGIPSVYYLDGGTGANYWQMFLDCYHRTHPFDGDGTEILFPDLTSGKPSPMPRITQLLALACDPQEAEKADEETRLELKQMLEAMKAYIPDGELPGCFPPGIVLAAGWDPQSVYETGCALGKEADFYGINVLLGTPNVNIHRDPLNGRLFEGYSEDPCLVSKLAPQFVKGVQDQGVLANAKHFAANNQETDRRTINEHIPERALREIYLPGFRACVQDGGCKTIMSAYNAINGQYCAMNPWLLTEVLRDEWGFDGYVVSDWSAAYVQAEALSAGNDVDMPGPRNIDKVIEAVESGRLDEKIIDQALGRVLSIILDSSAVKGRKNTTIDRESSRAAAYQSIKEAIILLKNDDTTLPLNRSSKVSFFGRKSKKFIESGGGSANVITDQTTNVYDCTVDLIGSQNVQFETVDSETDAVVVTVGVIGQEGFDRASLDLDQYDRDILAEAIAKAKSANKKIVVILNVCGPVDVSWFVNDIDAMICVFIPGMEGGRATADVLFGLVNPSGKLPITFPKRYRDCPSSGNFPGRGNEVWYAEGIFVGYRYYDYREIEPMYPFGFGLSYSTFVIVDAHFLHSRNI